MRTIPSAGVGGMLPEVAACPARKPVWMGRAIADDPTTARVLHAAWSGDSVVVPSPPGSGKTRLVVLLAASLAERAGLRVGVAAQTRQQAVQVAERLGALGHPAALVWRGESLPGVPEPARVVRVSATRFPAAGGGVVVATTARWLLSDHRKLRCDVMVVDEAWQATYADVCALGAFAAQLVCVGDPGQIAPVVTGRTGRWACSPTGPHQPAPEALLAAHPDDVTVVRMPYTWRLGPVTTGLVQPVFYPGLPFTSRRPAEHVAVRGQALAEVEEHSVQVAGPTDDRLVRAAADHARRLLAGRLVTAEGDRCLTPSDVAVVTPHVAQAVAVGALLADVPGVLVGTANRLQGVERTATVAIHPLAGYREPVGFGVDPGRACVMVSRHRAHLALLVDPLTRGVLAGAEADPALVVQARLLEGLRAA